MRRGRTYGGSPGTRDAPPASHYKIYNVKADGRERPASRLREEDD